MPLLAHKNPEGQVRPCYIHLTLLHPLNFHQFARFYGDEYGKNRGKLERHNVSRIAGVLFGKGMDAEIHADTGDGLQCEMRP